MLFADSLEENTNFVYEATDNILRTCNLTSALSTSVRILSPAVAKEIEISQKTSKYSATGYGQELYIGMTDLFKERFEVGLELGLGLELKVSVRVKTKVKCLNAE